MTRAAIVDPGSRRERVEGPLLTVAVVVLSELLAHSEFRVPNPPALLILAVVFSAFRGGRAAGWLSAAVAWTYCFYYFSQSIFPLTYQPDDLRRVLLWAIALPATAAMVGALKRQAERDRAARDEAMESQRVEYARREAEERLRLAVSASNLGVWEWEIATGRVNWDERTYELFGATPETFDNSYADFSSRLPVEHRPRVEGEIRRSVEQGEAYQTEFPILLPSGDLRWIATHGRLLTDSAGIPVRMLGVTWDDTQRHRVEESLRATEARFHAIADSAPVGIFETDRNGGTLFVNKGWCELFERSAEEAKGLGWLDAVHPDDRERISAGWVGRMPGERVLKATFRMLTSTGAVRWVEGRTVEMHSDSGEVTGYLGSLIDITEIRAAQEFARRRGAILSAVSFAGAQLLSSSDWRNEIGEVLRQLGEAAEVSRVYLFQNGWDSRREAVCTQIAEWVAPGIEPQIDNSELQELPYRDAGFERWFESFTAGQPIRGRITNFPDSERAILAAQNILSIAVIPVIAGSDLWGFIGFDDCVSGHEWSEIELRALEASASTLGAAIARQRSESELRESESRFRDLFDSSPVEIWEEDFSAVKSYIASQGFLESSDPIRFLGEHPEMVRAALGKIRIIDVNREAVRRLRAKNKEELLRELASVFTEKAYAAFERELLAIHRGETQLTLESRSKTFDGRTLETLLHWAVQPGHEEDLGRILISVLDVTEQWSLRQRIEQVNRLETVGQFAGGVAHDFNNLLMVILGSAEFLEREFELNERPLAEVQRVRTEATRAAQLTRQLLAFSRQQVLAPVALDLNEAIHNLRELLVRLLPENIALHLELAAEPAVVEVDSTQLEQVVMNLVVNARDAQPGGGSIEIATSGPRAFPAGAPERAEPIAFSGVLLTVRDRGAGMSPEALEHCFEPFFSTKSAAGGTGLGLATAYGIVRQSGGAIWGESGPGAGSTFSIFLPISQSAKSEPALLEHVELESRGESVLLVEDNESVRSIVVKMLESLGFRVVGMVSPLEALSWLESGEPVDLLLTDVMMAGLTGEQLAERATMIRPGLPVLFMSGYAHDLLESPASKRFRFLQKPFSRAALGSAIRETLHNG